MTDSWDERTEAIPGTKGEKSFELELEFVESLETTNIARASLVVFEPTAIGLADALKDLGFTVRMGTTGVDVMSVVAQDPPGVVLCAPAPDAERRRLLAAALRLRFPHIPIVYVSTHAGQEDAVLGAVREGARAVLAWPLPPASDVMRVLGPYLSPQASATGPAERSPRPGTGAAPVRTLVSDADGDESDSDSDSSEHDATVKQPRPRPVRPPASQESDAFEEAATLVTPSIASQAPIAPSPAPGKPAPAPLPVMTSPVPQLDRKPAPVTAATTSAKASKTSAQPAGPASKSKEVPHRIAGFADEPTTQPNMRPAANAVQEALAEKRGEIGDLLAAVSPFLWSLEDASRWAAELGAKGDPVAQSHARTLTLLAKILAQLQARIDDIGV